MKSKGEGRLYSVRSLDSSIGSLGLLLALLSVLSMAFSSCGGSSKKVELSVGAGQGKSTGASNLNGDDDSDDDSSADAVDDVPSDECRKNSCPPIELKAKVGGEMEGDYFLAFMNEAVDWDVRVDIPDDVDRDVVIRIVDVPAGLTAKGNGSDNEVEFIGTLSGAEKRGKMTIFIRDVDRCQALSDRSDCSSMPSDVPDKVEDWENKITARWRVVETAAYQRDEQHDWEQKVIDDRNAKECRQGLASGFIGSIFGNPGSIFTGAASCL